MRANPQPTVMATGGTTFSVLSSNQVQQAQPPSPGEDLSLLWQLLPNLRDLPEGLLMKLSPEAVLQLNAALGKDIKSTAKLSVNSRLAQCAKKLVANPVTLAAAADNRREILHPA